MTDKKLKLDFIMKVLLIGLSMFYIIAGVYFMINSETVVTTRLLVMILLIIDGCLYLLLNLWKNSPNLWIKIMWIGIVVGNLFLTVADQVGLADVFVILLNVVVLVIYILKQKGSLSE